MGHSSGLPNRYQIKTAMILAAGYGKRMEELSENIPKPLLPMGELTLIDLMLLKLRTAGIKRIVINIHFKKEKIRNHFQNYPPSKLKIFFSEEEKLLGTGGGIAAAEPFFKQETILVANSDILCDLSLENFFDFHFSSNSIASMVIKPSKNVRKYTQVYYNSEKVIIAFATDKIEPVTGDSGIFTGFQILSPEARSYLKREPSSVIQDFYIPAIKNKQKISAYLHRGSWIDLGTKDRYLKFYKKISTSKFKLEKFFQ
jgi:mannose-1-phosphate guanylyltransferase